MKDAELIKEITGSLFNFAFTAKKSAEGHALEIIELVRDSEWVKVKAPTENMLDAPRMLIMYLSFDGKQTLEGLRDHLDCAGVDYSCWPDWAREEAGHLNKSTIAELIYTMMIAEATATNQ
jgi:hypothetical protein